MFDIPALVDTLRRIEGREIRAVTVDSAIPSPFASALLFGYVANYIYDGDAPLAERRAQALSIDQAQLRELLGEAELRELLDADALADVEAQLQQLEARYRARSVDGVHDLLLHLGDLTREEINGRAAIPVGRCASTGWRGSAASSSCRSRARRGWFRSSMPRGIAMRSAYRCRWAFPNRCSRRSATPRSIWRDAMRGHMGRSRPPSSRPVTAWGDRPATRCSRRSRRRAGCSKESSVQAGRAASGATRTSFRRSAGARSPSCGRKSNRSNRRSWRAW